MARVAEFIVKANSIEVARSYYRPIIELGPAGRYWVEDFLQTWVSVGLEMSVDLHTFVKIWEDMVRYAMTLPAWQPSESGYWSRAESLAADLVGLHKAAASVLGQAKYQSVIQSNGSGVRAMGERVVEARILGGLVCSLPADRIRPSLAVIGD